MKYFVTYLFLVIAISISNAQSFPHLNASTGNKGEFPVDKDTNIYMFYYELLTKTDKNFNIIWSKYTNGLITHLLLSKTGSLYFIKGSNDFGISIGKIDPNGNEVWNKNIFSLSAGLYSQASCKSLLLDHNDQLIISGNMQTSQPKEVGFFLKIDTNGVPIKLRVIDGNLTSNLSVAYDSSGHYKFVGSGPITIGPSNALAIITYNDATDQIENTRIFYYKGGNTNMAWRYIRSKFNNSFYIHLSNLPNSIGSFHTGLIKCSSGGSQKWALEMSGFEGLPAYLGFSRSVVESTSGELFYQHDVNSYTQKYRSGVFKIDSTGSTSGIGIKVIDDFPQPAALHKIISHNPQTITMNNHYIDIVTDDIASDPLQLRTFDANLSNSCALTTYCSYTLFPPIMAIGYATNTLQSISSYSFYSTTNNNFQKSTSINYNNCTLIGIHENSYSQQYQIIPNPVSNIMNITDLDAEHITITDIFGKVVLEQNENASKVNVQALPPGLYFIKLNSRNRTFISKFIKE